MRAVPRRLVDPRRRRRSASRWRRSCGGSVARSTLVEGRDRVLPREPAAIGEARRRGAARRRRRLHLGQHAAEAARDGDDYVLELDDGRELRGDRLLVATGRRPRVDDLGLETVGIEPGARGIEVDERLRAGAGVWAIGDVNGVSAFTHVGKYQGRVVAADILGPAGAGRLRAIPRVVFTDPQAAAVGEADGALTGTVPMSGIPRAHTYERAYAARPGFLTLVSDGEVLTGAYAVGPEAGEWLQQATLAIRARVPLDVLRDTIQPFPTFSEIYVKALEAMGT